MTIATKHKRAALENQNKQLHLQIRNETLEIVQCTKYLGVHIDNSLDWKIGMLKYAKRYIPFHALKTLFTSVIGPYFRYCCSVWEVCGATAIQNHYRQQACT